MPKTTNKEPSFEQALAQLEAIIEAMEEGETPLADLVAKFEEGTKLLNQCQSKLSEAELKIEKLNAESGALEAIEDLSEPQTS